MKFRQGKEEKEKFVSSPHKIKREKFFSHFMNKVCGDDDCEMTDLKKSKFLYYAKLTFLSF